MPMPDWGSWLPEEMPMPNKLFSGIPAFIYDFSVSKSKNNTPSAAVYGRAGCITFHYLQFGVLDVHWVSLSLPPTTAFENTGMSECPASSQSGTGMNKNSNAGTSPLPE
jgi:hypothetical protein